MEDMIVLDRRGFIAAGVVTTLRPSVVQAATAGEMSFAVFRNGTKIGRHDISITKDLEKTVVDIKIELNVKLAFITLYSYQHRNREIWDSFGLTRFDSVTNDNGDENIVSAERIGDQIKVAGKEGDIAVPISSIPTTYWRREFMDTDRWIDTQYGRVVESQVSNRGLDRIDAMDMEIDAEHFVLEGDLDLELWYRGHDWVKLRFETSDGSIIDYVLEKAPFVLQPAAKQAVQAG